MTYATTADITARYPGVIQVKAFGPIGAQTHYENVWGLVEVPESADRIEISVRSIRRGGAAIVPAVHCRRGERALICTRCSATGRGTSTARTSIMTPMSWQPQKSARH